MTEREATFVKEFTSFVGHAKVNLGQRGSAHRQAFMDAVRIRLERFFGDDESIAPKADPRGVRGADSRIHRVTPRTPSPRPGGIVEMTQSESMRIDAQAGTAPEITDG